MRKISKTAKLAVAGVSVGTLALSGVAYAYWTTGGSGTGSGSTAAGAANQLSVAGDVANAMFPGDNPQTVTATVTNNGTENYRVQTLSAYVTTDKGSDCTGDNYLINGNPAPSTSGTAVDLSITAKDLAPSGTQTKTFTMQFNNKAATNQDLCKSAAVTIHYIAS
jgi:hypothetical protein